VVVKALAMGIVDGVALRLDTLSGGGTGCDVISSTFSFYFCSKLIIQLLFKNVRGLQ